MSILLAFSPVSHFEGIKPCIDDEPVTDAPVHLLRLPEDESFLNLRLRHRYRNSRSIQKLTLFLGKELGKYLDLKEIPETNIDGDKPVWIDIEKNTAKLESALKYIQEKLKNDQKNEKVLLYDKDLPLQTQTFLRDSQKKFRYKEVTEERLFHGCQTDTIIYVGSGHLEAFTRPKLKLFIVSLEGSVFWYRKFQPALSKAASKELLEIKTV